METDVLTTILDKYALSDMQQLILSAFKGNEVEWHDLVATVRASKSVKNWVTQVRGPMQAMINAGILVRDPDIMRECYHLVPPQ